jgi:hypothetical protein
MRIVDAGGWPWQPFSDGYLACAHWPTPREELHPRRHPGRLTSQRLHDVSLSDDSGICFIQNLMAANPARWLPDESARLREVAANVLCRRPVSNQCCASGTDQSSPTRAAHEACHQPDEFRRNPDHVVRSSVLNAYVEQVGCGECHEGRTLAVFSPFRHHAYELSESGCAAQPLLNSVMTTCETTPMLRAVERAAHTLAC